MENGKVTAYNVDDRLPDGHLHCIRLRVHSYATTSLDDTDHQSSEFDNLSLCVRSE